MKLTILAMALIGSALTTAASAADQKVTSTVSLSGFVNSSIKIEMKSTDAFDNVHVCSTGNSSGCSTSNSYSKPPKNIGNVLCFAPASYQLTSSCQSLLAQGASNKCKSNILRSICGTSLTTIAPSCNWRTSAQTSTPAQWTWSLSYSGGVMQIDCSQSGFQGPQQ